MLISGRVQQSLPPGRPAPRLLPLCLLLCLGAPALAGPVAALQVYGALGYAHDDNLLRVPDGLPPFDNRYGDSWTTAEAGLLFDHTYSRQHLSGQLKLSKVTFGHFRQLDYDGKDAQADWNWEIGNHLEGALGASYNQTLAPYTDFRSDERNLRQQRRAHVDGAWRMHPSWQLRAGAARDKFRYAVASQRFNDRTEDAVEFGGDYLPRSGSTLGLVARKVKGSYPNPRPLGGALVDEGYDQHELKARLHWIASGNTNVSALAGWVRRKQPALGGATRGFNGRLSATHAPRGKLSYNAALWREFAPIESTLVSYTLNKGASIGASYAASAKFKLEAAASAERRAYSPRLALGGGALKDAVRSASVRVSYTPLRKFTLSAALQHQARSGAVALGTGSFKSNSIVLNASAQF